MEVGVTRNVSKFMLQTVAVPTNNFSGQVTVLPLFR